MAKREIFRKNSNGWYFRMRVKDENGNSKLKRFSGFKTKTEAKKVYLKYKSEPYRETSNELFRNLITKWFDTVYKNSVAETTAETRWYSIRKHILPHFGNVPINKITTKTIDEFYYKKLDEGLSPKTIKDFHNTLRNVFNQGVKWSLVVNNPVLNATPPKIEKKEMKIWNKEETDRFINYILGKENEAFYLLAIYTGMRRGELLGLKWEDIDFENRKIRIQRSLARITGKGLVLGDVKTRNSRRTISIPPFVVASLKRHKEQQEDRKRKLQGIYNDQDMVFTSYNGNFKDPDNILREFKSHIKKAGVPEITLHDLRHLHSTMLLKIGINPKIVSERLGHSSIDVTMDIYSHVTPDMQEDVAIMLEKNYSEIFR